MKKTTRAFVSSIVAALAMAGAALAKDAPAPPDLTKGQTAGVNRAGTYNLGATGLRGWMRARNSLPRSR